ncbi:MAG: polysaccharide biosynthesis C-terminal domain-containing protein [Lewinella sp.]|nr:polysaccharide biosynthesis C-terminal domain-containing protein [Lewinella sp.]
MLSRYSSWLTNVRAMQLFQLFRQGGVILTAILLAQSGLPTAQLGQYEMLLFIGTLLSFAWLTGFLQSLLGLYPRLTKESQVQLKGQAWLTFCLLSAVVAGALLLFPDQIVRAFTQKGGIPFTILFAFFLLLNWPAYLQEHFYLLDDRPRAIFTYGFLSATAQLLLIAGPPWLGWDFTWSFRGLCLLGLAKWSWLTVYVFQHSTIRWNRRLWQAWWRPARPLVLYALLGILVQSFGPWFVGYYFAGDEAQFALYRYGSKELPLVMALAGAFSTALIPVVAADLTTGLEQLRRKMQSLLHLIFPLTIVLLLTSRWWFVWVFTEDFSASVPLFNTFLLTTIWHLWFVRTVLVALQDNRWQPLFVIAAGVAMVIFCILFTPRFGLVGIALGTVLAYGVEKVLLTIYLWRRHGLSPASYTPLGWFLGYSVALLGAYLISMQYA